MTVAEYLQDRAEALEDIQEDGYLARLFVANPAAAPAWDPSYDPETGTDIWVLEEKRVRKKDEDGDPIQMLNLVVAVYPDGLELEQGDQILSNSQRWRLVEIEEVSPGGVVVVFRVKCVKG